MFGKNLAARKNIDITYMVENRQRICFKKNISFFIGFYLKLMENKKMCEILVNYSLNIVENKCNIDIKVDILVDFWKNSGKNTKIKNNIRINR